MRKIGSFKVKEKRKKKEILISDLKIGFNSSRDHIIKVDENYNVSQVIDKVCDHAGGRLILKGENAVCPMHNWSLDLNTLQYNDSHICKKQAEYRIIDNSKIELFNSENHLENPYLDKKTNSDLTIRWLNHAAVYIEANGISFITDPWLFGPAFMTGWWLNEPSTLDSTELLKEVDYIYISHNHPDHLHPETLRLVSKDKKIIVGDFKTKSTEKYLRALGFTNIISLGFNDIYDIVPNFQISILKSGDFRDDSGIYFNLNGYQVLLTVDCNFLNSNILPQKIDLLMTSFAGGASGFPLCFDNYSIEEKKKVILRNKLAIRSSVINYLKATSPINYLPYAGMFKEYAKRDAFIKDNNEKNATIDYEQICNSLNVDYIEPEKNKLIQFIDGVISFREIDVKYLQKEDYSFYINKYKEEYIYDPANIISYLKNSGHHSNQIVQIIPSNDTFDEIMDEVVFADFKNQVFKIISRNDIIDKKEGFKVMKLSVRPEIITCVIENKLPWEDFSIGFQMRVERSPNEYESDFWYHFTNVYINDEHFRYSPYCGSCTVINQNPIWNKTNNKQHI
jgi:CMP-N-acetylneuraminate monooxygenase